MTRVSLRDMGEHHPPGVFERRPGEPAPPEPSGRLFAAGALAWVLCAVVVAVTVGDRYVTGIVMALTSAGIPITLWIGHRTWWLVRLRRGAIPADAVEAAALAEVERAARAPEEVPVRRQVTTFVVGGIGFAAGLVLGALVLSDDQGGLIWVSGLAGAYVASLGLRLGSRRASHRRRGSGVPSGS